MHIVVTARDFIRVTAPPHFVSLLQISFHLIHPRQVFARDCGVEGRTDASPLLESRVQYGLCFIQPAHLYV